jgi:two-component system, LuxR family, response regulator FixJ
MPTEQSNRADLFGQPQMLVASRAKSADRATDTWWSSVDHCVHVVDDDARFLEVMRYTLDSVEIRNRSYMSAEHFLATFTSHDADCVLLDLRMPGMDGLDLLQVLGDHVAPPILMLSAYSDTPDIVCAIQRGALDYLLKPIDEQALLTKVTAALRKNWSDKQCYGDLIRRLQSLSDREREVMKLFASAKTTTQVAHLLGISPKTVEKHRVHIFQKLNIDSVPELICLLSSSSV